MTFHLESKRECNYSCVKLFLKRYPLLLTNFPYIWHIWKSVMLWPMMSGHLGLTQLSTCSNIKIRTQAKCYQLQVKTLQKIWTLFCIKTQIQYYKIRTSTMFSLVLSCKIDLHFNSSKISGLYPIITMWTLIYQWIIS